MDDPTDILDTILGDFLTGLADDALIAGAMADLNTDGYGLDGYDITRAAFVDGDPSRIAFSVDAHYSGEWDRERPLTATTVIAGVTGVATRQGDTWTVTDYEVVGADVADDFEDDLDDDVDEDPA
jgi:hypothetical protein